MSGSRSTPSPPRSSTASRAQYQARINRVVDYIEAHLDRPLDLKALAKIAHFSPYHFHRIFSGMVGETLHQFVARLRIERAANLLLASPDLDVTSVAMDCGFSSPTTFARAFKQAFGMSATAWRREAIRNPGERLRKNREMLDNDCEAPRDFDCYFLTQATVPTWKYRMKSSKHPLEADIRVEDCPEHHVVYLRHVGPYGQADIIPKLVQRLRAWVSARGLWTADTKCICIAHDNPTITESSKLRTSVCMTAPADTAVEGEVGSMTVAGGRYAIGRFDIPPRRIGEAWRSMFADWMPDSGYQPDDRLCYEIALNDPREHPDGLIQLAIHVPVTPL